MPAHKCKSDPLPSAQDADARKGLVIMNSESAGIESEQEFMMAASPEVRAKLCGGEVTWSGSLALWSWCQGVSYSNSGTGDRSEVTEWGGCV
jgi:hypothetical protein